jgi:predicted transcriptional regulator
MYIIGNMKTKAQLPDLKILKSILALNGVTLDTFAIKCGCKYPHLYRVLMGHTDCSVELQKDIARNFARYKRLAKMKKYI